MALKRNKSNIVNLNLIVASEDGKSGMTIDQTIINGKCAKVAFRVINGKKCLQQATTKPEAGRTLSRWITF